jgi:membrane fusion protein, multidrug efflux system
MRPFPILTAIAAIVVLFFLVFQRDTLRGIAGLDRDPATVSAASPDAAPPPADNAGDDEAAGVSVIAQSSTAREIDSLVVLRGRTEAARAVDLMSETAGKVVSAPTPKGTLVSAGDVLCEIDIGTRNAALAEAEARLAEARANAPTAQARVAEAEAREAEASTNLRNAESLFTDGFAAETRVIAARAAMEGARASVSAAKAGAASAEAAIESAQAAVASVSRDIENTRITAPFDGVLESDTAELGSLLMAGSACARVLDLDPIRLVGFVAEVDVDRVTLGAPAIARLSSGREVTGRVTFLSRSADSTTRTFRVEAEVANADLSLRDGQTAEIMIQSAGRMAHLLPQSALTLDDAGTVGVRIAVPQGSGHVARFVPVELLRDTREGVWVTGLDDSADVIVVGQDYVTDGVAVTVTFRESGA